MYYGEKVCLRAYREEDIARATELVNDKELKKFLVNGIPFPMTQWEEEEWIRSQKGNENGEYNFAIEDIKTGKYIGGCGIHKVNWLSRVATVGIMIGDKNYWGKGYGTDAMKVLMKFIFEDMNMNKIRLSVFSFNERAKRCYEKCGFQVEGILKKEIFKEGKYYDEIIMSAFNK
ncbi:MULTISPECIES: GNAT family N-acetyltransferase [Clostridium]|uniref:Spermidine N(1)-acetyltransferase n=2 Tax=Clostridium TaxID=1485 RepID=A0A151APQ1_9CLOT|nr:MULTISPECIES: GNAT family protein [Clostridium]KYH29616.1 spermidine N(1)-acetyltransferase [Clostridium colicanis DSM 13634]MBE6043920.1 GNAT family N-acetyltransferase [Clostridium thermopalmarium]PRR72067.1 Spermidine N(1)-acetyltransferase [Clostridium thermopalmarium DSM 5974]PVZ23720.1 RimJ/RimL family protein N-acetyltransferase [Clostridium thermopalmarium DSM 5974]